LKVKIFKKGRGKKEENVDRKSVKKKRKEKQMQRRGIESNEQIRSRYACFYEYIYIYSIYIYIYGGNNKNEVSFQWEIKSSG
jgi:hypothetical protein